VNLANDNCATVSDIYQIEVVPAPLAPSGNALTEFCEGESGVLQAVVSAGERIDWYGQASGGTPLLSDSREFSPPSAGIYYAETVDVRSGCLSTTRTALELRYVPLPNVQDETLDFCQGTSALLSAGFAGGTYQWSTGEMSPDISVREPGTYTVLVTNRAGCGVTKIIVLEEIIVPRITLVRSDHREIQIEVAEAGDYEYSIDGFSFQDSPNFPDQVGGPYVIVAREKNGCGDSRLNYNHLVIPRFFTPNGDTQNQEFTIEGAAGLSQFELRIFDRMGQLLFQTNDPGIRWSGLRDGRPLPSSDYWYVLRAGDQVLRGHFTLKR
jgi:gliding motility-associated-like protein